MYYVQDKVGGTIFREDAKGNYSYFDPWENKWVAMSHKDGTDEFHDYDNNWTNCSGKNIDEVTKLQAEYCKTHKDDLSLEVLSSFHLR